MRAIGVLRIEQARDAEVQQAWTSLGIDEDIGRLEITMNDEIAMRE
ncbi:hypothetical protein [Dokdonella sp.]|nr:hypothetical protein [Dokdonella sp.]